MGPAGKQQLMHSRGCGRTSASRMVQGTHLPGRPRDTWLEGGWAMTTTWLGSGRGICSPLVAFPGTPRGSESPSPCLPGCGSATRLSVLAPVSASSPWVLRGAPPFPSDSISPRQLGARPLPAAALTSGTRKPLRVFLCVQPKGRASPSSYSAGSQRASALLAAPSAGLLLKWQGWPSASAGQLLGLLVRTPQGIPPGKDGSLCPRETGCGGGASEVCGGLDHSHPRRLGAPPPQGKALLPAVYTVVSSDKLGK